MTITERLKGSLICGAIGDSLGGYYEGRDSVDELLFDFDWSVSDDTQMTLATCEAIYNTNSVDPANIANRFLYWFNSRRLTGLGSSTLKALRELQVGGHWALVGRSGEYAAGNGAAMRIAPLAFKKDIDRLTIKDICSITHKNDEAYVGALAIYYSIKYAIENRWSGDNTLISKIVDLLPDTRVRDRLIELDELKDASIQDISDKYKSTGYVVDSVPLSVFAAQKIGSMNFQDIITDLIKIGGDTDTVCSMTGQIIGSLKGTEVVPDVWMTKYNGLDVTGLIDNIVCSWVL
jgi:ADP-ribosylglycohydrolase